MPGNKAVFSDAINKGSNAAWDGNWKVAIAEYRRAVAEMPQDAGAHLSLAHVLEQSKQFEEAVDECQTAAKLSPQDPEPLTRVANLQEKLGQLSHAAGTYLTVAEMYANGQESERAVEMWQRAAVLEPERMDAHVKLAQAYEQGDKRDLASKEYVALAKICGRRGDKIKMAGHAQHAVALDPRNIAARKLLNEIQKSEPNPQPQSTTSNPVDQAKQAALSSLAATLLENKPAMVASEEKEAKLSSPAMDPAAADALIARAVDAQTQHSYQQAIDCYKQLLAGGISRPEVKFNLAQLYFETNKYDDAITLFNQVVSESKYALAGQFTLGQCYRAKGQHDQAAEHFLQVTKIVDLTSVGRDKADELISVYEGLAESFAAKGDHEQAESFSRSLEEFLTNKGWEDKVKEVRQNLDNLRDEGGQVSLAEVINLPNSTQVLQALSLSQDHLRNGKYTAAGDECLRAIELAPLYVAAHIRLAKILAQAGQIDEARNKYNALAGLSAVRGELARSERFFRQLLALVPDDADCRVKLIDVLVRQKRNQAALEQYLELGDNLVHQGQYNVAADRYAQGIELADKTGISGPIVLQLYNQMAQARSTQGDFKNALAAYADLHRRFPDDEPALVALVDLEFRLGQTNAAIKDLEELLTRLRSRNEPAQAIAILQELAKNHPDSITLRARLAQYFVAIDDRPNAIAALDSLGELQLSAGNKQAAAATIRQIIALNPPNIEDYKQLLMGLAE